MVIKNLLFQNVIIVSFFIPENAGIRLLRNCGFSLADKIKSVESISCYYTKGFHSFRFKQVTPRHNGRIATFLETGNLKNQVTVGNFGTIEQAAIR